VASPDVADMRLQYSVEAGRSTQDASSRIAALRLPWRLEDRMSGTPRRSGSRCGRRIEVCRLGSAHV
jgi:hypothetical protein